MLLQATWAAASFGLVVNPTKHGYCQGCLFASSGWSTQATWTSANGCWLLVLCDVAGLFEGNGVIKTHVLGILAAAQW
eukprot:m.290159 g.290159  ORF g.290159 m.290159 type:complete len:78 (+) comp19462_c1_seq13:3953-4186(+)